MARRLFGEIHPITYRMSVAKGRFLRNVSDLRPSLRLARTRDAANLPAVVYRHNSLIRRRLGNVNPELQENKAVSLSIAAPKVDGVLIRPGEVFSFWKLVGPVTARRGYKEGLTIDHDRAASGIGGGMCQFTNLIHWMVLHTPLAIVEHHHHSGLDLFPDFNRQIPFGTGTSIVYNYLDYRFRNPTSQTFQLRVSAGPEYLSGSSARNPPSRSSTTSTRRSPASFGRTDASTGTTPSTGPRGTSAPGSRSCASTCPPTRRWSATRRS
ncbi:vancomycin resistance protein VanW [Sinomonas atrocyanea]|uniref:VanW family protein n=1 Tax=Sinomonas atrocyanea TaxID=37927 RepID=UPI002781B9AC|nr:VanW family protein [Sinomonas atrocyanea]MDP9884574.1 vancomycin resistance protein VanW [Sinomonas atrocyanea]